MSFTLEPDNGDGRSFDTSCPEAFFTKIGGHANLYKVKTHGPKGVLFRRIETLQDALSCGGLFLMNAAGRWQFWVGQDLRDALAWGQVAMRPSLIRRVMRYNASGHATVVGGHVSDGTPLTFPSTTAHLRLQAVKSFDAMETVYAIGIVTAAQYGLGSSTFPEFTGARSYMATAVAMNVSFAAFMEKAKAVTLDSAPSEVRKYYEGTYDQALTQYGAALLKPSLAVHTMWDGSGTEVELTDSAWGSKAYRTGSIPSTADAYTGWMVSLAECYPGLSGMDATAKANMLADLADAGDRWTNNEGRTCSFGQLPMALTVKRPGKTYNTTASGVVVPDLYWYQHTGPGCVSLGGAWKGFSTLGDESVAGAGKKCGFHNGVTESLQAGWLRDFHMLELSMNQAVRKHELPASHSTIEAFAEASIGPRPGGFLFDDSVVEVGEIAAQLDYAKDLTFTSYSSFANRGSLLGHIERFSDRWDKLAEAAARADR